MPIDTHSQLPPLGGDTTLASVPEPGVVHELFLLMPLTTTPELALVPAMAILACSHSPVSVESALAPGGQWMHHHPVGTFLRWG